MTRRIIRFVLVMFALAVLKLILSQASHPLATAADHLLFGFINFILRNASLLSFNPDTVLPGLLAFVGAAAIAHVFCKSRARKCNRPWTIPTTLALAGILPLLFIISLLVPGILLQVRALLPQ